MNASNVFPHLLFNSFVDITRVILDMTQNFIPPSEIIICVIRLGIGEGANVIFKQVSHTIR